MPSAIMPRSFRFEGFTLDLGRGCLRRGDHPVDLRPKSFAVLRYLVENAARLVSKDELFKAVWPNVFVTDDALTHCISEIRAALGDRGQHVIKTVPRRGYLFAAALTLTATSDRSPQSSRRKHRRWILQILPLEYVRTSSSRIRTERASSGLRRSADS